jgi:diacylglycerol O-acyltransferase / wax synthase
MDRLSPLDATFLHIEDDVTHMHMGSVGLFEGPPPPHDELLAGIEAKLHLVPRYRQKVRFVPLKAGRPVWVDDAHFNLGYHVRRTALPPPGGDEELRRLIGRVMSQQLDRARPLWEWWVVEGLGDGRWAVISKLHHAMADGIAGTHLINLLMDESRDAPRPEPVPWTAALEPPAAALVADSLAERARWPLRELGRARAALRDPRGFLDHAAETAHGLAAYSGIVRPAAATALNGPLGPHRSWDWARSRLSDVKEIRTAFGGTVNDVVLTAVTKGFRDLLESRGEPVGRPVRTLVPVSVRAQDESGVYDNRVSAMFAELPVAVEDPLERLEVISLQMTHLKETHEAVAGEVLTSLTGFAPEVLLAAGGWLGTRAPQHNVNTVTTNVPGPQYTLYVLGRRMLEAFPYVPLGGHVRCGVAIYSYDGGLGFGVTGDFDAAPDVGVLAAGIERGMAELLRAARAKEPKSRRNGRSAGTERKRVR